MQTLFNCQTVVTLSCETTCLFRCEIKYAELDMFCELPVNAARDRRQHLVGLQSWHSDHLRDVAKNGPTLTGWAWNLVQIIQESLPYG